MLQTFRFRRFQANDAEGCLRLFDKNCPRFFAPIERGDYEAFLAGEPIGYAVGLDDGEIVAAFGFEVGPERKGNSLNWIMIAPDRQGAGIGRAIMESVRSTAAGLGVETVEIAASQLSAPFFARFGAHEVAQTPHGWGPGRHRIDMDWPIRSPAA